MIEQYPIISDKYNIHFYGDISFIDDLQTRISQYFYIDLDEVGTDIIVLCNGLNSLNDVYKKIVEEYNLDIDDSEVKSLFSDFINDMLEKGILELKDEPKEQEFSFSGERGKLYPYLVNIELTNSCNLSCKHCYKETITSGTYLEYDKIIEILNFLKGRTPVINIVGGEPALHKNINEIIKATNNNFSSILLTNGTVLNCVEASNLEGLRSSQVSMYGFDKDSYEKATGNSYGFKNFCDGILKLKKSGVEVSVAIIINKDNLNNLAKYIKVLLDLEVDELKFGLASLHGRAIEDRDRWIFNQDELRRVKNIVNNYSNLYRDFIRIDTWGDNDYIFRDVKIPDTNRKKYEFNCIAGKTSITINEDGRVRPCAYLPNKFFDMGDYREYFSKVLSGTETSFNMALKSYELYLNKDGIKLNDLRCKGLA